MAWIRTVDENEADGELKELYDELSGKRGKVSNIMRAQSLNPRAMKAHLDLYLSLMFAESGLTREQRELIGTAVSVTNGCRYCARHHAIALNHYWKDDERIKAFIKDPGRLDLPEKDMRLVVYAIKLTAEPSEISRDDVESLRQSGFTDEDILNVNMIVSYFNFVNRIAVGLGVEFTQEEVKGYKY